MAEIANTVGQSPGSIEIGGKEYKVGGLDLGVLADMEVFAERRKYRRRLDAVKELANIRTPEDLQTWDAYLNEPLKENIPVLDENKKPRMVKSKVEGAGDVPEMTSELDQCLSSAEGIRYMAVRILIRDNLGLTEAQAGALLTPGIIEQLTERIVDQSPKVETPRETVAPAAPVVTGINAEPTP